MNCRGAIGGVLAAAGFVAVLSLAGSPTVQALPTAAGDGWATNWADQQVGRGVALGHASAAVVSVVRDGRTILLKGYGAADHPDGRPVDPVSDQFQIASVSKTFTAALLSQLIDQGRVKSLDDPANLYLKRARLPVWKRAITLKDLVTHSAGFEERGFGYFDYGRTTVPASGDYVRRAIPAQVRPPGSRAVYANIDPTLVGAAIEDITGLTLQQRMSQSLLAPLGMTHTVLNYTQDGGPVLVRAYAAGRRIPGTFNNPFFAPTGSIQTTGQDMTAYMNAVLGLRPAVLSPAAVSRLTTAQFGNDPSLDKLGMYWFLSHWGSVGVVEHAGGLQGVQAWVILVPERRLGVFIAWAGGSPPMDYGLLHDSFLTAALGPPPPLALIYHPTDLGQYAGRYRDERRPHATPEIVGFLGDSTLTVRQGQGGLMIGDKGPYLETSPGAFIRQTPVGRLGDSVAFRKGEMLERVDYARRVEGLGDPTNQQILGLIAAVVTFSGAMSVFWPGGWGKWPALLGGLAALVIPLALMLPGADGGLTNAMQHGHALRFDIVSLAMVVIAVCLVWLLVGLARSAGPDWRGGLRAKAALVHAMTVCAGMTTLVALLMSWNFTKLMSL